MGPGPPREPPGLSRAGRSNLLRDTRLTLVAENGHFSNKGGCNHHPYSNLSPGAECAGSHTRHCHTNASLVLRLLPPAAQAKAIKQRAKDTSTNRSGHLGVVRGAG